MDVSSHSLDANLELGELATAPNGTTSFVPLKSAAESMPAGVVDTLDPLPHNHNHNGVPKSASNSSNGNGHSQSSLTMYEKNVERSMSNSSDGHSQSSLQMFEQIVPDLAEETSNEAPPINPTTATTTTTTATTAATNPTAIQAKPLAPTTFKTPKGFKEAEVSHELIPPEAAEVPPETTPGDAVVNPLEVPHLLTLESNESRLTQGIDGSHIYAAGYQYQYQYQSRSSHQNQTNPDQDETTLCGESTTTTTTLSQQHIPAWSSSSTLSNGRQSLLEDWLDQVVMVDDKIQVDMTTTTTTTNNNHNNNHHTIPKHRTLGGFLEYLKPMYTASGNGIPLSLLLEACHAIDCLTCRQDAISDAEQIQKQQQQQQQSHRLVLTTDCLQDSRDAGQEVTVEAAFDYQALEEGHHVPLGQVEETVDLETTISLLWIQQQEEDKERNTSSKSFPSTTPTPQWCLQPLTEKHISNLVEQWLPCGIDEDIMVTTLPTLGPESSLTQSHPAVLDPKEFQAIQANVLENVKDVRETCADLNQMGYDLRQSMDQVSASFANKNCSNLEYSTFPMLRDCDTSCNKYQDKLLEVMNMVTSEKSHALQGLQLRLWTHYLRALNSTLQACESYYTQVSDELADQLGVVPKMFVSAPLRSLYQTLVEEKVKIWSNLGRDIFAQELTTSVLQEWYTRQVWIDVRNKNFQDEESLQLDDACHDLVKSLSSWTEIALGGRVAEIQRQRMSQTEHVLESLQTIIEPLAREYARVERYFSQERNRYFASLRSNILLAQGVRQAMRLIDQNEVECMATGVVLMWRQMRLMTSRMTLSCKVPPLPLQLKRWMLQEHQYDEWPSSSMAHNSQYCRAGCGGKRRVHCIMAGLIYNWLEDRCQEWNAELAEQELLGTLFGMEDTTETSAISATTNNSSTPALNNPTTTTTKASKSSRRKKKKKSAASSGHRPDTIHAASNGNGAALEGVLFDESCEGFEDFTDQELASPSLEDQVLEDKANGNGNGNGNTSKEFSEPDMELEKVEEEYHEIDSYPSSVFIMDDKEILSAQDFLVGRLLKAFETGDSMDVVYL
jgi:hypothetical protein